MPVSCTHLGSSRPKRSDSAMDSVAKLIAMHPQYAEDYENARASLYDDNGPLSPSCRHFVALMGACRHRCQYLIKVHRQKFCDAGGDPTWLDGISRAPQKFRDLDTINKQLAHRPWELCPASIKNLTKAGSDNWSLPELLHAMVLLCHTHSLCSFVHGCGCGDSPGDVDVPKISSSPSSNGCGPQLCNGAAVQNGNGAGPENEVEQLLARLNELSEVRLNESESESSQEDRLRQFIDINVQSAEIPAGSLSNGATDNGCPSPGQFVYSDDLSFRYVDFAKRNEPSVAPTMKLHEYNWNDAGFDQANQLCPNISTSLDTKFRTIKSLTYYSLGDHTNVETTPYREAIWHYILSLYGVRLDDYDYAEVNKLLTRQMKSFIKTTRALRESVMKDFQPSEKVHVNILISEARFQAELLYGLRSITRFRTQPIGGDSDDDSEGNQS